MATPTWTTLTGAKATTGSIKSWVVQDNIPSEDILSEAETEIYRRLRVRQMLAEATGTIADGDTSIALPTGFKQAKLLRITGTNQGIIRPRRIETVQAGITYDSDSTRAEGKPAWYGLTASAMQLDVEADQAYPYAFLHFAALTALGAGNTSNFLCTEHPRILRAMCMAYAWEFVEDEKLKIYWLKVAGEAIEAANGEAGLEVENMIERVEVV